MKTQIKKNITTILSDVGHTCESWCLTLRDERTLEIFKNMMLRKIFEPKRKVLAVGWRKLHTEKLHNFCCLLSIIRVINLSKKCAGYVAYMGEGDTFRVLVRKPEGRTPLGLLRCRLKHNIKEVLKELGWEGMVWIDWVQCSYKHSPEHSVSINMENFLTR
jgi:hypothetical protein